MTFPLISILSYNEAQARLRSDANAEITHVVSINDPAGRPPSSLRAHPSKRLILNFHDVNGASLDWDAPQRDHVARIVKFARGIAPSSNVICHCAAGISRSSAAALTILASTMTPSIETAQVALQKVRQIKDAIYPNSLMVKYADELLGYQGSLVAAHRTMFSRISLIEIIAETYNEI